MANSSLHPAASGWLGKAAAGVDDAQLATNLQTAHNLVKTACQDLASESRNVDAVAKLGTAEDILHKYDNPEKWPGGENNHYYRCIYNGGDGSGYESGFYRNTKADTTLEAIELLKQQGYEDDPVLSR